MLISGPPTCIAYVTWIVLVLVSTLWFAGGDAAYAWENISPAIPLVGAYLVCGSSLWEMIIVALDLLLLPWRRIMSLHAELTACRFLWS